MILWDVRRGLPTELFEGHGGDAEMQVFSPDGRTLYTAGEDSRVIVWDVAGDRRLGVPFRTGFVTEATGPCRGALPPPSRSAPTGERSPARLDGRVDLIDAETLRADRRLRGLRRQAGGRDRVRAGRGTLAVAGVGGGVGVWDAASGTRIGALLRAPRGPVEPTFHTEERWATRTTSRRSPSARAICSPRRRWGHRADLGRRSARAPAGPPLRLPPAVLGLAFSPDGSRLAIPFGARPSENDGIEVRDVGSGERLATLPTVNEVLSAAFSPDGSMLAAGRVDGSALVWLTDGWSQVGQPLALPRRSALGVAFSPDGRTLATSTRRRNRRPLGRRLAAADRLRFRSRPTCAPTRQAHPAPASVPIRRHDSA